MTVFGTTVVDTEVVGTKVVDSAQFAVAERTDAIHELARGIVPVNLSFTPPTQPFVRGTVTDLGDLLLSSIWSNAATVERTASLASDHLPPSLMLGLQKRGTSLVVQHGREAVVGPGDLVVYESTSPYTLIDADGYAQDQIRVPIETLAIPERRLHEVCAVRLSPGHPISDLASTYFRRLASRPHELAPLQRTAVSTPSVELLRAVILSHLDATAAAADSLNAALQLRVLEYARNHLREPSLNASQIAAEHHISVRQLYNVLAEAEVSLGDWIRTQRLAGCRNDLRLPEARSETIATVARRWGFLDPSTFGRLFKATYGLSPKEWRDAERPPGEPDSTTPPPSS